MKLFNAQTIRVGRLQRRVSQAELAEKVGLSTATLSRIENGQRLPSAEEVEAISTALESLPRKPWAVTESDATSIVRVTGSQKRLRVEVSLEEIICTMKGRPRKDITTADKSVKDGTSLIFYVPLDGLALRETSSEEADESEVTEYPRIR